MRGRKRLALNRERKREREREREREMIQILVSLLFKLKNCNLISNLINSHLQSKFETTTISMD